MKFKQNKVVQFILLLLFMIVTSSQIFGQHMEKNNIRNLGPQVFDRSINGSRFAQDAQGVRWIYTVLRGSPARLLGYKVGKAVPEVDIPLNGATGSWSVVESTDGWLYIASDANALLYRIKIGTNRLEELGLVLPGETYLWTLTAGRDGEIFGGTYPGGKVFRYHPTDGFSEIGKGAVKDGEQYVRSLVYHAKTDQLFAGIGANTSLIQLHPRTGEKKELLPEGYQGHSGFVYDLGLLENNSRGDILLVTLSGTSKHNKTLLYNIEKNTFEGEMGVIVAKSARQAPDKELFYFTNSTALYSYDFQAGRLKQKRLLPTKSSLASSWTHPDTLVFLTSDAKLRFFNPQSSQLDSLVLVVPPSAIQINTLAFGPDGNIWTSGYPVGSNATYDPGNGEKKQYYGLSQAESMTSMNGALYFGIYSGAKIYKYSKEDPWDGKKNPRLLGHLEGQDRPFATASVNGKAGKKLFFGTVPKYGILGGALAAYDEGGDFLQTYPLHTKDLSIVSLLSKDQLLFAGTSIWGGLGVKPTATEAKLFVYEYEKHVLRKEMVPIPKAQAITALLKGPDGHIWGIADTYLFILHKDKMEVVYKENIFENFKKDENAHVWKNAKMLLHPNGLIYLVAFNKLWSLDPSSKKLKLIHDTAGNNLILDPTTNNLYFNQDINLYEYKPQ